MLNFIKRHWRDILLFGFIIWCLWRFDVFGSQWETIDSKDALFPIKTSFQEGFLSQSNIGIILTVEPRAYAKNQAERLGLNWEKFSCLINCESGWNENAIGDNGLAFGLLQYHKSTFDSYCKGDYYNGYDQIDCSIEMIKGGGGYHWRICYNKCYAN